MTTEKRTVGRPRKYQTEEERIAGQSSRYKEWHNRKKQEDPAWYRNRLAKQVAATIVWQRNKRKQDPEWAAKQMVKRNECHRRCYQKNPEKFRELSRNSSKRRRQKDPIKVLLGAIKARAKQLGLEFDLEHSDIVVPERCPVLSIPIGFLKKERRPIFGFRGQD